MQSGLAISMEGAILINESSEYTRKGAAIDGS